MRNFVLVFCFLFSTTLFANSVAIIDSGTDLDHEALSAVKWINPNEIAGNDVDDDGNEYIDDIFGWNFAEKNNQIIDMKHVGTFGKDVYTFFEVQGKYIRGTATEEEIKWMKAKIQDEAFRKELGKFGNFMHGTHVAGISAKGNKSKIMGLKLIPTGDSVGAMIDNFKKNYPVLKDARNDFLVIMLLGFIADQNAKMLVTVGKYVNSVKANVANCSFGTSMAIARMITRQVLAQFGNENPTDEEVDKFAKQFMNDLITKSAEFIESAPNTLFVIAAGNDGTNNSVDPASPANIKKNNSITVAATMDRDKLASFSSYSKELVELAAPGVTIMSAIPGTEYLEVSGTSQASPDVANVAAAILEVNPQLAPINVKKVLMDTVDKKDWLKEYVKSGGIVNKERAIQAARNSMRMPLADAILAAREDVADIKGSGKLRGIDENLLYVIPLQSPIF